MFQRTQESMQVHQIVILLACGQASFSGESWEEWGEEKRLFPSREIVVVFP